LTKEVEVSVFRSSPISGHFNALPQVEYLLQRLNGLSEEEIAALQSR